LRSNSARPRSESATSRRPLRKLEPNEAETFETLRRTALQMLPFYSHMLYKVRPVVADEEPKMGPDGKPHFEMRAGIMEDWRLILNFDWIQHEFDTAYEQHGDTIRQALIDDGIANPREDAIRGGCEMMASFQLSKVLLHEMGHAMYDTWDLGKQKHIDSSLLNMAEDAVINNPLRVLGAPKGEMDESNINGEFIANAVYGGSIKCDDPSHSWEHLDPDTGERSRRCSYDQTTSHYYDRLKRQQDQQQSSEQGGQGSDQNANEDESVGGENTGQRKGAKGGSDRERDQGGSSSETSNEEDQEGDEGQGSGGADEGGEGEPDGTPGCGKSAAEKYADDPLEKGEVSDSQKRVSLDVTASEVERWAEENEERAKKAGFGSGSMARRWAAHRRRPDKIRWDKVLGRKVRRSIESAKQTRDTYSAVRRRDMGNSSVSRPIRRGTKSGHMPSISAAIDTSGSMSQDELFLAYNSVRSVIKRTGIRSLNAFAVDSAAKSKPVKISKAEDIGPLLKGGGGTDMCAGIEVAAANGDDVCVVFTDGEVPWEKMRTRPSHIKNMEVVVAVIAESEQGKALAARVPSWMQTVQVDKSLLNQDDHNDDTFLG
jgi:predicted metal-dependent peptidase